MRVVRTIVALFFLAALIIQGAAAVCAEKGEAAPADERRLVALALKGQEEIFARNYSAARKIFEELTREYPKSPVGPFGTMAINEVKMLEREDHHLDKQFEAAAREGVQRVSGILQMYHPGSWDLFLSGSLLGLDGFYKARRDAWWDAYVQGNKSRQLFRRVKRMDPGFVDADFGLGMYLYWRSVFTRDLWFLRMFPDRRAEGIAIVERVARDGYFAKDLAKVNLAIMYFEEKRFPQAERVLVEYVTRYPNNIILRRLYGKVLISLRRYSAAVDQFRAILKIDPDLKKPHYFIGAALVIQGDPAKLGEAQDELRKFLKIQKGNYWPAHAHYWLGRLELKRGNKDAAQREFDAAVKLYPGIEKAVKKVRGLGGGV